MSTKRNRRIAVIAAGVIATVAIGFGVVACSGDDGSTDAAPRPSASATAEPTAPAPTEAATPEPVVPTEPGAIVPADMVDAARAAGASVYVSPNGDGAGVVTQPGVVPDAVIADAAAAPRTLTGMGDVGTVLNTFDGMARALDEAGIPALFIMENGAATDGAFMPNGFALAPTKLAAGAPSLIQTPKADVLAAAQAYIAAHPETLLIDLTA